MEAGDKEQIERLFADYLRMYSSRDERLTSYFSEDFSGFTGGGQELVHRRDNWVEITRQDFAEVTDPIRIDVKDLSIQLLGTGVAVATSFFVIHLPIPDHILSRETARLVLVFRREDGQWKICHSSISIPYHLVGPGEVYPLRELVERNRALEVLVEERTSELSAANSRLRDANEMLANKIVEHRSADEALRLSEDKFGKAFHRSPDAVLITRVSDGAVVEVNEGFVKLSGYAREEALASSALTLDLWADTSDRERCIAALREGAVGDMEFGFRIKSGEVVDCVYGGSLLEVNGEAHILSVVRDVSKQRRAEAAVRHSEQTLRGILDNVQDAYVRADARGRFTMVSPSAAKLYGYPSTDAMIGMATESLYANQTERQQLIAELHRQGHVADMVGLGLKKDGTTFIVSINAQVLYDDHGQVAGMEGFVRDITERKRAEQELERSRERYRVLVENINDVIFIVDLGGILTYVSPAIERLFGYNAVDVEGLPFSRFVHPDDLRQLDDGLLKAASGARTDHEFRVIDKAGAIRWVAVRTSLVVDGDQPPSLTGVMTDFTERKRAEDDLALLNEELANRAAALEVANARIAETAATDDLTGLANRRRFHESLDKAISRARRHGSPLALVSLDLDGLKQVNDNAGHDAGDRVLTSFAALIGGLCRSEDLPSRFGGDEFCVLLPDTDVAGARRFADRAVAGVRMSETLRERGVTVSAGAAEWSVGEARDDLLRRADEAMYAAKKSGGDDAAEYEPLELRRDLAS